jgi:hypothetical protein
MARDRGRHRRDRGAGGCRGRRAGRLQLIEGAGHHLPRRALDAVVDAIAAFLAVTEEADHRVERRSRTFGGRRRIKAAVVLADPLALAGIADAYRGCGWRITSRRLPARDSIQAAPAALAEFTIAGACSNV